MAEKEGFEPSIPFWGIHDFQSCALGQLRDFSIQAFSKLEYITPFVLICQDLFFILLKLFYKAMKNPAHIRERDFGASDLTRTGDLLITSEMHYRLCYTSKLFLSLCIITGLSETQQTWRSRVAGRARTIGNRVYPKRVSRVQIPPSPP